MLKQLHEQIEALNLLHYTNIELSNSQLIIMRIKAVDAPNYQCIAEVINIAELADDSIYNLHYNSEDEIVITLCDT